jgi:signal transduction histidine kinase
MPFPLHTFRRAAYALLACGALALLMLADQHGAPGSLLPHGYCFTWNPALLWTHVVSDTLIGLAYVSIPLTLLHLVRKRTDMPFNWIVLLFASFIVSCGATHWIEVWTVWYPDYWLSAGVKVITATASVLTAAALVYLVPHILAIPTVAQLTATKAALEEEVRQRRAVEEELRRERAELEHRVEARTSELGEAIASEKAALARAEEASLQKDRFLAKVSHELRTPLQSTLSWSQVLRMTDVTQEQAALAAERIVHNVRSQARLIDDLLDISRILSGKLRLEWQEADVMAVVEKAVEVVRAGARSKAVDIEVVHELDDTRLLTDPVRLEQIVWNLVSNAVQASLKGGVVLVTLRLDGQALRIDVQDWGQGIAPDDLPHLFEPFRQGLRSENTHRGLGLGLAITRNIATLFGGELSVRSSGPGQGACFTVKLPLQAPTGRHEPAPGPGAALDPEELGRLRGLRVLYVEDEPDIAEGGRLMLSGLGAQVSVCLSFDEARRRVAEGGFDVLLSDLNLDNNRSGNELLRFLRGLPHGKELPALLLSAYGSEEERRISREAGFARHLVKPAGAEDVARALLESLPRPAP